MYLVRILDLSDAERDNAPLPQQPPPTSAANTDSHQQAINYSSLAATAAAVAAGNVKPSVPGQDQSLSSTETLLRNIQSLLTVAADNARQQERQITYEKGKRNGPQRDHKHIIRAYIYISVLYL